VPLLSPAPCSPTSPLSFAPSVRLARPLSRSAHACRDLRHCPHRSPPVLRPPSRSRPVQCHSELRLTVSYSGHPSVCPLPPCCTRSTLTGVILARPDLRHRCCPVTPSLPLEVRNLHAPLISCVLPCCSRDCSPEQSSAAVSLPLCVQRPLVLPRRHEGYGRVRQTPLIAPRLVPEPLVPGRGRSPRLRRAPAAGPSGATAPKFAPLPLDPSRPPEIERFRLNPSGSDRSPPIQIQPSLPSPLPRVSAPGPSRSARPGSLAPWPRLSVAPA
jgi:hypothetical protein